MSAGHLLSTSSKAKRLESEKRTRWFVSSDEPREHQTASLKALWGPLLRPDATDILFPSRIGSMVGARWWLFFFGIESQGNATSACKWASRATLTAGIVQLM